MIHTDSRGYLHSLKELPFEPKQILISKSRKGTIRGLHKSPYPKYVYVIEGSILDFFVHPKNKETEVQLGVGESVIIPADSPHGFYAIEDSTIIYMLGGYYNEAMDQTIFWNTPEFNFPRMKTMQEPFIVSHKDSSASYSRTYDVVLLGSTGYLGKHAYNEITKEGLSVLNITSRLNDHDSINDHIKRSKCRYVVCAAGISGKPTIDWCDTHEYETWETNYLDMLNLMRVCKDNNVHLTIFGSGLVFKADNDAAVFTEDDVPNFDDKVYTKYRIMLESATKLFTNVLYLRILFPTTFDGDEKSFMTKVLKRASNVHNVSVPLTIVPSLFPYLPVLLKSNITGILNFVNKGVISLTRLLEIAKQPYIISRDSLTKRGNYELDISRLEGNVGQIEHVCDAVTQYII